MKDGCRYMIGSSSDAISSSVREPTRHDMTKFLPACNHPVYNAIACLQCPRLFSVRSHDRQRASIYSLRDRHAILINRIHLMTHVALDTNLRHQHNLLLIPLDNLIPIAPDIIIRSILPLASFYAFLEIRRLLLTRLPLSVPLLAIDPLSNQNQKDKH